MFSKPFSQLDIFNQLSFIAFVMIVSFICIYALSYLLVKKYNESQTRTLNTILFSVFFGFVLSFATIMFAVTMGEMVANEEVFSKLFYPILAVFLVVVVAFFGGFLVNLVKPEFMPKYKFFAIIIAIVPIIVTVVMLALYYKDIADWYENVSQLGLYLGAFLLLVVLALGVFVVGKNKDKDNKGKTDTRALAYAGVTIALSFALSYIRLFKLPQGGSVTLASLLPIMLYSYIFGTKKGVMVGFIYGVMQALQDPWIIHPAQFFLDYPIAFAMIGLTGIFKEINLFKNKNILNFLLGGILASVLRYFSHVFSGIFAFSMYAPDGFSAVAWGFLYNTFVFADILIALVCGSILFTSKSFVKTLER